MNICILTYIYLHKLHNLHNLHSAIFWSYFSDGKAFCAWNCGASELLEEEAQPKCVIRVRRMRYVTYASFNNDDLCLRALYIAPVFLYHYSCWSVSGRRMPWTSKHHPVHVSLEQNFTRRLRTWTSSGLLPTWELTWNEPQFGSWISWMHIHIQCANGTPIFFAFLWLISTHFPRFVA